MKNPFESTFSRRVDKAAERARERAQIEQEIADIQTQIDALEHYISQGETRPGDAQQLEQLKQKLSTKQAKLTETGL